MVGVDTKKRLGPRHYFCNLRSRSRLLVISCAPDTGVLAVKYGERCF